MKTLFTFSQYFFILTGIAGCAIGSICLIWNFSIPNSYTAVKLAPSLDAYLPVPENTQGKLVAVTGIIQSSEILGDEYIVPSTYLFLERVTEIYAWHESCLGYGEKEDICHRSRNEKDHTLQYYGGWTRSPETHYVYEEYTDTYKNPKKEIEDKTLILQKYTFGNYAVNLQKTTLDSLRKYPLPLTTNMIVASSSASITSDGYLFIPSSPTSTYNVPKIGDVRIQYFAVPLNTPVTIFAKQEGTALLPYRHSEHLVINNLFFGTKEDSLYFFKHIQFFGTLLFSVIGIALIMSGIISFFLSKGCRSIIKNYKEIEENYTPTPMVTPPKIL